MSGDVMVSAAATIARAVPGMINTFNHPLDTVSALFWGVARAADGAFSDQRTGRQVVGAAGTALGRMTPREFSMAAGEAIGTGVLLLSPAKLGWARPAGAAGETLVPGLAELNPALVRFSQTAPRAQGSTVRAIAHSMRQRGFVVDPDRLMDVVRMPDGQLTTLDNTRLLAASDAGVNIQARIWQFDDLMPNDPLFVDRFAGRNGQLPVTFGEAVTNRIGRQSATYRNNYPVGSWQIGRGERYWGN
jgi:hypothetical protein